MTRSLLRSFSPSLYRFGRPAAVVCGVYLTAVAAAAGLVVYDTLYPDPNAVGASFAAVPLVLLTAPTSLVTAEVVALLQAALVPAGGGPVADALGLGLMLGVSLLTAVVQAALVYLVIRGPQRRVDGHPSSMSTA